MADEEKPRRRRRRTKAEADDATVSAAGSTPETAEEPEVDEVEPTAADVEAEDAAADVMLEADDEAEGTAETDDSEDESPEEPAEEAEPAEEVAAPRRGRRLRRGAAEPKADTPTKAPAKPAPTRRRGRRDPSLPPPVVRAQAKYVRSSARKARLVCDHIRGKSVEDARAILALTPRAVARDWSKLLESAVANAEHNHELVGEDLYIKAVRADEGPTIKRFRPRALGRATRIRKRTSHLTILLTPKE
jgi:ribosomal protein L22